MVETTSGGRLDRAVRTDAVEITGRPRSGCILYTCEHASRRVPRPLRTTALDRQLLAMHWGYDIGAAWLTRELVRLGRDAGVLARASRLVADLNRNPLEETYILRDTHEGVVSFNTAVDEAEHARRTARFFTPFHEAVRDRLALTRPRLLFSIHSYTPVWRGQPRTVEAGVLFDQHDEAALRLVEGLRAEGLRAEPNEPYSGKVGLIYSAALHGQAAGVPYLELEVRQDLIATRPLAVAMAARVRRALTASGW